MNFDQARFNMIEQQIRTWEVLDPKVLSLLNDVHREKFVAPSQQALAFADIELPILLSDGAPSKHAMLFPKVEAKLIQALELKGHESVLQVGAGSGYLAALLAKCAKEVNVVEIEPAMAEIARARLNAQAVHGVSITVGDGFKPTGASYDAIVLTGSVPSVPELFKLALKPGGVLFAVVGSLPVMKAVTVVKDKTTGTFLQTELFETVLKPLASFPEKAKFEF
jgi:protein-L-isoaspartate(D-aspartate) O-methyltransferase